MTRYLRWAACMALTGMLLGIIAPSAQALDDDRRARAALAYLSSEQQPDGSIPAFSPIGSTADAILSFVSAGIGRRQVRDAIRFLRSETAAGNVDTTGLRAKVLLAVVAAGKDPRSFGGHNLIQEIKTSEQPDGRYGMGTAVFDHALAILGLRAADKNPSDPAVEWLLSAQCADGGWQYDNPPQEGEDAHCYNPLDMDWFQSDTNTTALAVQALETTTGSEPPYMQNPFRFFRDIRDEQFDGWGYTWGFETTDANSTAMVIQAYVKAGRRPPAGSMAALRGLQFGKKCGAFGYTWVPDGSGGFKPDAPNVGATIAAVPGLLRKPLPERPRRLAGFDPENVMCP